MSKSLPLLVTLAAFAAMPVPGVAQPVVGYGDSADPASQLSANLMILSQNPRDLSALIGAGQSAIAVGDGNAALSFLARAEEISPRNGRIKAALGTALVMLERPGEALKLFAEAHALGIPDIDIAADRGLAYDLRGDPRRAQRDYLIAQRIAPSDEVTRRLALSFGISGDRDHALSLLDPLLRKQDQGAWRARAFILAMTGDLAGAEGVARSVMPVGASDTMTPFLRRLPQLNLAERALAVTFGTMPSDGTRLAMVEAGDPFRPVGAGGGLVPAGEPLGRAEDLTQTRKAEPVSRDPRRRPGREPGTANIVSAPVRSDAAVAARPGFSTPTQIATASPPPVPGRIERRIESRIGDVRQDRLPPEIRTRMVRTEDKPADVAGTGGPARIASAAPVPAAIAPPSVKVETPPPVQLAVAAPEPVFEVAAAPPPPAPDPAAVTPSAAKAVSAPPDPAYEIPATDQSAPPVRTQIASVALPPSRVASDAGSAVPQTGSAALASFSLPAGASSVVLGDGGKPAPVVQSPPSVPPPAPAGEASQIVSAPQPAPPMGDAAPVTAAAAPRGFRIAEIIATIEPEAESVAAPLPTAAELRAARLAAQRKAEAKAKADAEAKAAKDSKDAEKLAAAKHPARIWVQVATGANEAGLPSTWKKLRDKSPATFKGLNAASVPFRATNRLLVGPFRSQTEARALLGAMQKAGMAGSTYASDAGQEVAKIAAR